MRRPPRSATNGTFRLARQLGTAAGPAPTIVITDKNDVLRDEGEAYAHRLQDAGVPTVSTRYNGIIHDFGLLNGLADLPTTKAMIRQVADGIRAHIGSNRTGQLRLDRVGKPKAGTSAPAFSSGAALPQVHLCNRLTPVEPRRNSRRIWTVRDTDADIKRQKRSQASGSASKDPRDQGAKTERQGGRTDAFSGGYPRHQRGAQRACWPMCLHSTSRPRTFTGT